MEVRGCYIDLLELYLCNYNSLGVDGGGEEHTYPPPKIKPYRSNSRGVVLLPNEGMYEE